MKKLTHIMAIGYNAWGKGKSVEEALRNWQKSNGSFRGDKMTVHLRAVSEGAYVDDMGHLYGERMEKLPDIVFTKADFEAVFMGRLILLDLIHGYEISDRVYDLKESDINDDFD